MYCHVWCIHYYSYNPYCVYHVICVEGYISWGGGAAAAIGFSWGGGIHANSPSQDSSDQQQLSIEGVQEYPTNIIQYS